MESNDRHFRYLPQFGVENNFCPSLAFSVINVSFGNGDAGHFFQAKCLRAELYPIRIIRLRLPSLVFHRNDSPILKEFHDVSLSGESQSVTHKRQTACDLDPRSCFIGAVVSPMMKDGTLNGKSVLRPNPLQMDERTLALAEEEMLEGGER
jgi:hypothetical protein